MNDLGGAKMMEPEDLSSITTFGNLIHVTVNSKLMGFIDDMYMVAQPYGDIENPSQLQVSMQSQLRMGSSDFM